MADCLRWRSVMLLLVAAPAKSALYRLVNRCLPIFCSSHSIMQFALRTSGESGPPKTVGKLSFIDLAGSERGADT